MSVSKFPKQARWESAKRLVESLEKQLDRLRATDAPDVAVNAMLQRLSVARTELREAELSLRKGAS